MQSPHRFIVEDLASGDRNVTPWIVLNGHRPIYTTSSSGGSLSSVTTVARDLRAALEDVLIEYEVGLCLHAQNVKLRWAVGCCALDHSLNTRHSFSLRLSSTRPVSIAVARANFASASQGALSLSFQLQPVSCSCRWICHGMVMTTSTSAPAQSTKAPASLPTQTAPCLPPSIWSLAMLAMSSAGSPTPMCLHTGTSSTWSMATSAAPSMPLPSNVM